MSNFECEFCNFSTMIKSSYIRHLSTKKHKENDTTNNKYKCVPCSFHTNKLSNYKIHLSTKKHMITCQPDENDASHNSLVVYQSQATSHAITNISSTDKDIIIALQQQLLTEKDHRISDKDETNKILTSQLKVKDKQIKTSTGLLKYLMQNYPDAPAFQRISNMTFIKDDTQDRQRMPELLIEYYNTDRFVPYLVENIMKLYKKDDPKNQSLWTSDVSRDNYIIKNRINDTESKWMRDIKGAMIIENAIRPCLNLILDELNWYSEQIRDNLLYFDRINSTLISLTTMSKIRQDINDKKIEDDIRKKLSPEFCFPNNAIEGIKC
jgi:hypothetical protein